MRILTSIKNRVAKVRRAYYIATAPDQLVKASAQLKENLIKGLANDEICMPKHFSIKREGDWFTANIINDNGDALAEVARFKLESGNSVSIFNTDRAFNFTLS